MPYSAEQLRKIHSFKDLLIYLEEKLDWPLQRYQFDELTFEYQPEELGLKDEDAAKVRTIHQLRPLRHDQPWGIFFVEFENKKLPVVVLRRILSHLVVKKRASANRAGEAAWHSEDLMFITTFGEDGADRREIAFAHFHQSAGDLPTLHVLGWDGGDTPLKLVHLNADLQNHLHWPDDEADHNAWRQQWARPFRHKIGHVINTASALAEALAGLARGINERALKMLAVESDKGPLRMLYKAFQTALIHDLTEDTFADTYAQTITYGLLTAAISRTEWSEGRHGTFIIAENVSDMVPITNPFLKEMLSTFLKVGGRQDGIDFDELGIQDVVELLRGDETDLPAILRDFGNRTPGEDPVIHFYEHFLSAYNKKLKIQRGVFYTPQPVVSYIIRSVHELLQKDFGLEDGLASTITWGGEIKRHPGMKLPILTPKNPAKPGSKDILISPESPFVMILDFATGTGTFLVEVIDVIHKTMKAKWQKQGKREQEIETLWNEYVPKHLLPRLYGYELMMAPYAIAHMKIGLKLSETGYKFMSDERVRVYLTNTLEPASDAQQKIVGILPALAHEAEAVNAVKRNVRFSVIVGNPPYSNYGQLNKNPFILGLLESYKRGLDETKINLDDDFIKFFRHSHHQILETGFGCLGLITNHTFLDGVGHRRMREMLVSDFLKCHFVDLHGNTRRAERTPDGRIDENVFDIQQGVAISLLCLFPKAIQSPCVCLSDIYGSREEKYTKLSASSALATDFQLLHPAPPSYLFRVAEESEAIFRKGVALTDLFFLYSTGVETQRDDVAIHFSKRDLHEMVSHLRENKPENFRLWSNCGPDGRDWRITGAKADVINGDLDASVRQLEYRAFDSRWTFLTGKSKGFVAYPRWDFMRHLCSHSTLAIITVRQMAQDTIWSHLWVTRMPFERCLISNKTREANYGFLVHRRLDDDLLTGIGHEGAWESNFRISIRPDSTKTPEQDKISRAVEDAYYIYALLSAPSYREHFSGSLAREFPRVFKTSSISLYSDLAQLGGELIALHLLESPKVNDFITSFTGKGDNSIPKKPTWKDNAVWINPTQRFEGVPENVWNFHIGGYQVCEKWLKDRKGRTLSADDITHYQRIVVALNETIRIMAEIDKVIDEHGGWPGAFHFDETATVNGDTQMNNVVELQKRTDRIQRKYDEQEQPPLSMVADSGTNSNPDHEESEEAETKTEPRRSYEISDREDMICLVRQVFSDGIGRERDAAISDLARELGYQRTSSRIADELDDLLRTAVRRGIVENAGGTLRIAANSVEQYDRDFLKDQFVASLGGRQWVERDEAIRGFARWLGYLRTGKNIDEAARSLINGLIREGRIESDGTLIRRAS